MTSPLTDSDDYARLSEHDRERARFAIRRACHELEELLPELPYVSTFTRGVISGSSFDSRPPKGWSALALYGDVVWRIREIAAYLGGSATQSPFVVVAQRVAQIPDDMVVAIADELTELVGLVERVVSPQPPTFELGPCPVRLASGERCDDVVVVSMEGDSRRYRCPRCRTDRELSWWVSQLQPSTPVTLTRLRELALQVGISVSEATLRRMIARGQLVRCGGDGRQDLFDPQKSLAVLVAWDEGVQEVAL